LPSRRAPLHFFAAFALAIAGCGGRTGLDGFALPNDDEGGSLSTSGGASARGGNAPAGGRATGGVAGRTGGGNGDRSGNGGDGGNGGVAGGVNAGGALDGGPGGEPNGGAAGAEGGAGGAPPIARAVSLALGAFHSCVGFDDGALRCWGTRSYIGSGNKLTIGDDETPGSIGPVVVGGTVKQISAGWYHSCALLQSGNVRCFGNGAYGMLGYGNTEDIGDDETPASAGDVNLGDKVLQVSVGSYHTCAVLENAKLRCWGRNDHFQLGSSSEDIGDDEAPAAAAFVDVGGPVKQVAAGYAHSCALLENGRVRCWGTSNAGALGYGNLATVGNDESPAAAGDVEVGGKVTQIVAGMLHTCALLDNGRVRCWGSGSQGELGYGNLNNIGDDETPAAAGDVNVGGKVTQLEAGDFATCALLDTGAVRCWGAGTNGELGHGNLADLGDDETPASAGDIDIGAKATRIDVGTLHVCAILVTGGVRCWGRASTGALGYGNIFDIGDDEAPASAGDVMLQ